MIDLKVLKFINGLRIGDKVVPNRAISLQMKPYFTIDDVYIIQGKVFLRLKESLVSLPDATIDVSATIGANSDNDEFLNRMLVTITSLDGSERIFDFASREFVVKNKTKGISITQFTDGGIHKLNPKLSIVGIKYGR